MKLGLMLRFLFLRLLKDFDLSDRKFSKVGTGDPRANMETGPGPGKTGEGQDFPLPKASEIASAISSSPTSSFMSSREGGLSHLREPSK
jgi:hypothetical protein